MRALPQGMPFFQPPSQLPPWVTVFNPQQQPPKMGGILGGGPQGSGLLGGINPMMAAAASLLESSGPSTQRTSLGQAVGRSMMAGQAAQQNNIENQIRSLVLQKQLDAANRQPNMKPVVKDGKSIYMPEDQIEGMEVPGRGVPGDQIGVVNPEAYTPESVEKYKATGNYADLVRYNSPRQDFAPSYQRFSEQLPDGSMRYGIFDSRTGQKTYDDTVVPAGAKVRAEAQAKAEGEAAGAQSSKAPAQASMGYVLNRFSDVIDKAQQGGPMGVRGKLGWVTDYGDATEFDNLREQLSTELRTVFRIPGEGTLSDREQAQYGIQLPNRDYQKEVNQRIMQDIKERTRLRLETPTAPSGPPSGGRRVKVDAQGNVIGN